MLAGAVAGFLGAVATLVVGAFFGGSAAGLGLSATLGWGLALGFATGEFSIDGWRAAGAGKGAGTWNTRREAEADTGAGLTGGTVAGALLLLR